MKKTVIMTTMKRAQALKLRNYIRQVEPTAFMLISNSSELSERASLRSRFVLQLYLSKYTA